MALTEFKRGCARRSGGVISISLAKASDIEEVSIDTAAGCCLAIRLSAGQKFVSCEFREGSASLTEEASWQDGAMLVRHEIRLTVDPVDAQTGLLAGSLAEASRAGGLVAVVETAAGESFLVGWSEKFAAEQTLKMVSCISESGAVKSFVCGRAVTLRCSDSSHALTFTGTLS